MKRIGLVIGVWCTICLIIFGKSSFVGSEVVVYNEMKLLGNGEVEGVTDSNFAACIVASARKAENITTGVALNTSDGLTVSELTQIKKLECGSQNITDTSGLSQFTNLEVLEIYSNNFKSIALDSLTSLKSLNIGDVGLTSLDISKNVNLEFVEVSHNDLTTLDVSNNSKVTTLNAHTNDLVSLDVTNLTNLQSLNIGGNKLKSIDLSKNSKVSFLVLAYNSLSNLDLSNNSDLEYLDVRESDLVTVNFGNISKVKEIRLQYNNLESIDVSNFLGLTYLDVGGNKLSSIDLKNNSEITWLSLGENQLTNVDFSKLNKLSWVTLGDNKFEKIEITSNNLEGLYLIGTGADSIIINDDNPEKLQVLNLNSSELGQDFIQSFVNRFYNVKELKITYSDLTAIDLSKLTNLEILDLRRNAISDIDLSNNIKLTQLEVQYNNLSSIDVSGLNSLSYIDVGANNLTRVVLPSVGSSLETLYISTNKLESLDVSKYVNLKYLHAAVNEYESLDLTSNTKLETLVCSSDVVKTVDFSKLSNLKHLGNIDRFFIYIYGTSFSVSDVWSYIPSGISYQSYEANDGSGSALTKDDVIEVDEIPGYSFVDLWLHDVENSDVSNYTEEYWAQLYFNLMFRQLSSDKYVIDETNSKIDVGGDSDETILSNLVARDVDINIVGDKLTVLADGNVLKEFTLLRTNNPKTGDLILPIVLLITFIGIFISIIVYQKRLENKV